MKELHLIWGDEAMHGPHRGGLSSLVDQLVDPDSDGQPVTIERAEGRLLELGAHLSSLVGTEGYRALVERAVHLAASEFPFLQSVHPQREPPGALIGLDEATRRHSATEVGAALAAVLSRLLLLLTTFVGHELARRLLRDVWPWLDDVDPTGEGP